MADPKKLQVLGNIKGEPGKDGVTFIPAIDNDYDLSWTNDHGLDNPAPINIKGPRGDKGEPGEKGDSITVFTKVTNNVLVVDGLPSVDNIDNIGTLVVEF